MAVSMSATLALNTGNASIVAGQRFTLTLTMKESGGTNTNFVSATPFMTTEAGQVFNGARFGTLANAFTIGNYTGAAQTINASTSQTINFECVVDSPLQAYTPNGVDASYYIGCTCQTSDGSVFSTPPINVTVNQSTFPPQNGQNQIIGSTTNAYANTFTQGQVRFDQGANSHLIPLFA